MKVTLESTTKIVELNGIRARVWEGTTETGVPVQAYISRISCDVEADRSQFEAELAEQRVPSAAVLAIPARMVL